MIDIIFGIIFGFIIVGVLLSFVTDKTISQPKENLSTKELIEQLETLEKKEKSNNDKLLWFGLGALIGINLFD